MYKNIFIKIVRYFNILPSFLKALSSKGLSFIYVIIISLKADKSSKFVRLEQIIFIRSYQMKCFGVAVELIAVSP